MIAASLLYYDIPKRDGADVFPNPSPQLRRLGVRVNYSCWVMPDERIPYNLLNRMEMAGVSWNTLQFKTDDAAQLAHLIQTVAKSIREQVTEAVNSAQRTAESAGEERDGSEDSEDKAARRYLSRVRAASKKAATILGDLSHAARGFGLDFNMDSAFSQIRTIQTLSVARARVYANATKAIESMGEIDGMAEACRRNGMPSYMMADYLREHGQDEVADQLHHAFGY